MTDRELQRKLKALYKSLRGNMRKEFRRHVSFGDLFTDRWETARDYGFGEGTSCYDNVLILGDVTVGKNTWIGPNCILDGSGGLSIGDNCSISAGVQIYSHQTAKWANSMGVEPVETAPVTIGSGVYIGPQTVIQMGVKIGDQATLGACSLVNRDIPRKGKAWGCPARVQRK